MPCALVSMLAACWQPTISFLHDNNLVWQLQMEKHSPISHAADFFMQASHLKQAACWQPAHQALRQKPLVAAAHS